MFLLVYASSLTGINLEKTIWNNNLFVQIYSNALLLTKILSYTYKSLTICLVFPTFSRIKTWREREREKERERESWSQLIAMVPYLLPKVVKVFGQKVVERVLSAICTKHPNLFIHIYIYIYFTTLTLDNIEN